MQKLSVKLHKEQTLIISMVKYRRLTFDELKELEKEFVEYLVLNGIVAEDWERMKKEEKEKAEKIIDLFSDVIFESILRKVEYLEFREAKEIKTFQCLNDRLVLVGLSAHSQNDADFTSSSYIQKAIQSPPETLKIYTKEKTYSKSREMELFEMTEAGATISDGHLFKTLCLALPQEPVPSRL